MKTHKILSFFCSWGTILVMTKPLLSYRIMISWTLYRISPNASMSPQELKSGNSPQALSDIERISDVTSTGPSEEGCAKHSRRARDWHPVLDQKLQGLLYSFGASWDLWRGLGGAKMGEAYHDCSISEKDMKNTAQIGKGYYMKAMRPDADFDVSFVEAARKQRVETLRSAIKHIEKRDSVAKEDGKNVDAQRQVESKKGCLDELTLLRNYISPRRKWGQQTATVVDFLKQPTLPADSLLSVSITEDIPMSPEPYILEDVPSITAHGVWAVLRQGEEWPHREDMVDGWPAGDFDASTNISASNAATWRNESKHEEWPEEAKGSQVRKPPVGSAGRLNELEERWNAGDSETEKPERRDSALADLDEAQPDTAGDQSEAKSSVADVRNTFSTWLNSFPVPDRYRAPLSMDHTSGWEEAAQQLPGQEEPVSESMVLDSAEFAAPLTSEEKGKWPAECECSRCCFQRRAASLRREARGRHQRVRFDEEAMDKAEDGPGLSFEGFVKMLRENRRRVEAEQRGEGCSSWATAGPAGLEMFVHPRPAPCVPVNVPVDGQKKNSKTIERERPQKKRVKRHEIGEPMAQNDTMKGKYSVFPCVFPRRNSSTQSGTVLPRAVTPMAVERYGRSRRVWLGLSRQFRW